MCSYAPYLLRQAWDTLAVTLLHGLRGYAHDKPLPLSLIRYDNSFLKCVELAATRALGIRDKLKPFSLVRVTPGHLKSVFEDISVSLLRISETCLGGGESTSYSELGSKCGESARRATREGSVTRSLARSLAHYLTHSLPHSLPHGSLCTTRQ